MNPVVLSLIEPDGLYSQADIARMTGVNITTVYRWLVGNNGRPGKLPFSIRRGNGRPIVRGRDLIKFLGTKY